ncbi:hypothetical protein FKP32DRAFT_1569028 [Trametes sanguinea]|nr:hypothetical protein FKP32DRAFT_1569028 [Trametes sanguinea]
MKPTQIVTKERGRAPTNIFHRSKDRDIIYCDLVLLPPRPLSMGQRVDIRVASSLSSAPGTANSTRYVAKPAGVVGSIRGIRSVEKETVELVVVNESEHEQSLAAYLTVPYIHGVTIQLPWWWRALRILVLPFLRSTRNVRIEVDATVVDNAETSGVWRSSGRPQVWMRDKDGYWGRQRCLE